MANDEKIPEVRKSIGIKKQTFTPKSGTAASPQVDHDALQQNIGLRRKLGGAEDRSDADDEAMFEATPDESADVDPVEIIEDDD